MLIALVTGKFIVFADSKIFHGSVFLFLLFLSIYGLTVLEKKLKLTVWDNDYTKQQNIETLKFVLVSLNIPENRLTDDNVHFMYEDSLWSFFTADIHLFAGDHCIVINVRDFRGGFGDFGKCKSTEEMIERLVLQASA